MARKFPPLPLKGGRQARKPDRPGGESKPFNSLTVILILCIQIHKLQFASSSARRQLRQTLSILSPPLAYEQQPRLFPGILSPLQATD
jgi:hypothetical protein